MATAGDAPGRFLGQRALIFVSVGTMMPFDRLVKTADDWAAAHPAQDVLIQIGDGRYVPQHARHVRLLKSAEYRSVVAGAALFVAHAGMGSIITAIQTGKPLLMLPRRHALGEHNNDHQLATVRNVANRPGLHHVEDEAELGAAIDRLLDRAGDAPAPISPHASDGLIDAVRAFIAR
jgi:UDP-N-acetylglucosamine transferase subunit ALG13